jgi:hypothetical protein
MKTSRRRFVCARYMIPLASLVALLLASCASGAGQVAHGRAPTGTSASDNSKQAPSLGPWHQVLPSERFTGNSEEQGLATSPATPEQVVGCALPAPDLTSAHPTLMVSSDAGHSWQSHSIDILGDVPSCTVMSDTQNAHTVVVGSGDATTLAVSTNDGLTWQRLALPTNAIVGMVGLPGYGSPVLVAGHLIGELNTMSDRTGWHLVETTLDGTWRRLDTTLPYSPHNSSPESFAVDPHDASHIYVAVYMPSGRAGQAGIAVYETSDAGDSWHLIRMFPTSQRLALWTSADGSVYAEDSLDSAEPAYQLFRRIDNGAHWNGIGLHDRGADVLYVGPTGRILTTADGTLYSLDAITGEFIRLADLSSLGATTSGGLSIGCVVEGQRPLFFYAAQSGTFALPLAPFTAQPTS